MWQTLHIYILYILQLMKHWNCKCECNMKLNCIISIPIIFMWTFINHTKIERGTAVAQWLRCCATNRKVAGSIPAGDIGIFHRHKILPITLWPWGQISLQQKWVPGAFPGDKGGRWVRLTTLTPSCVIVMKSGDLNFLEPSGPLQACKRTALPFTDYTFQFWFTKQF